MCLTIYLFFLQLFAIFYPLTLSTNIIWFRIKIVFFYSPFKNEISKRWQVERIYNWGVTMGIKGMFSKCSPHLKNLCWTFSIWFGIDSRMRIPDRWIILELFLTPASFVQKTKKKNQFNKIIYVRTDSISTNREIYTGRPVLVGWF